MICGHVGLTFVHHNAYKTSLLSGFLGYAMIWPLSHLSSHLLERSLNPSLPIIRMSGLGQTFMQGDSGGQRQSAFFDIRVFYPNTPSYCHTSVPSLYRHHEVKKKHEYGDHAREVEQASFTPLVSAAIGGMGRKAIVFLLLSSISLQLC